MTTLNQKRAKSTRIHDHLQRRPRRDSVDQQVRSVIARRRRERRLRHGGLAAELAADRQLKQEAKHEARTLILGRTGRRIGLVALLRQRREDGNPRWCLVDPLHQPSQRNGGYDEDGDVSIAKASAKIVNYDHDCLYVECQARAKNVVPQGGFPALPPRVRELASNPKIRKRAEFVAVLYQPAEWREINPDPALVVKWEGIDGYFALAVWGGDRAELMEFVD